MSLLSMSIGISCKRNAPRDEPQFLGYDLNVQNPIKDLNVIETPSGPKPSDGRLKKLYDYYKAIKNDLTSLLNQISCSKLLDQLGSGELTYSKELAKEILLLNVPATVSHTLENNFSALVEAGQMGVDFNGKGQNNRDIAHTLPNKLGVFFNRGREDGSWDKRRLVGIEALTINTRRPLPNLEKHSFYLIAFLVDRPVDRSNYFQHDSQQLVACGKSGAQWYYYDHVKTYPLSNDQAIDLASKYGTIFFYNRDSLLS